MAIGRLAIGGLSVRRAKFRSVEIEDLTVGRLRVIEPTPSTRADPSRWRQMQAGAAPDGTERRS
jgi:hypothetical protein